MHEAKSRKKQKLHCRGIYCRPFGHRVKQYIFYKDHKTGTDTHAEAILGISFD